MNNGSAKASSHPMVVISFDDGYVSRFTRDLQNMLPVLHVTPLLRTLKASMESLLPAIAVFDLQTVKTEDHSIFEIMAAVNENFPQVRIIALGSQNMPSQVIASMKAGACDFLDRDVSPQELRDAVASQMRQANNQHNENTGRVIAISSGRGNEGESEVAANVAAYLAQSRPAGDVLLLDLNLEESQLEIEFNVEVTYSVRNAVDELLRLDKPVLMEVLAKHDSGLCLLPLTTHRHSDDEINPQELSTLISAFRNLFSIIVVNAGCLRDKDCRPYLMPLFDDVLFVCPQVIGSIRSVRDIIADSRAENAATHFNLIVSKYNPMIELSAAKIAARLGIRLLATLPANWAMLANSHNEGVPLVLSAPNNRYSRAVRDLVRQLLSETMAQERPVRRTRDRLLFGWFGNLKRAAT